MNRVWVVEQGDRYEGYVLIGIFKKQQTADKCAKELNEKEVMYGYEAIVSVYEVK